MAAVVEIRDLSLEFPTYRGPVHALSDVTLSVGAGEIVGLVGESGCGKSVTSMSAIRLLPPGSSRITKGNIRVIGRDILSTAERELQDMRGKLVSMVFQEPMNALNPTIRIGRQITQVIHRHERMSRTEAEARAEGLLAEMQVPDARRVMRNYPFELSGGMRQRVLLAMAFSCNPKVLIADEPTTALDVTVQAQVLTLLREKAKERGTSVLFITHDLAVVAQLCDRVYVMYAGKIVEQGRTADVLRRPLHPYTQALLRSLPELGQPKSPLASIAGTVPDLIHPPGGCLFRPRCAFAHDRCAEVPPLLRGGGEEVEHAAACWLLADGPEDSASKGGTELRSNDTTVPSARPAKQTLLTLDGIEMRFPVGTNWRGRPRGYVHALNGVDLEVQRGETLGIVGESGCGKSTLGQIVMGLLRPSGGRVLFDGIDLGSLPGSEMQRMRRRFQVVFQDPQASLNPRMTVWRVIAEPLAVAGGRTTAWLKDKARELALQVGLRPDQLERYPHEFSGGQRQRIAIARALALDPELLVLDEPTSALDVSVQAQILNLLLRLQRDLDLTYLFISHNVSVVRHVADRVAVMYLGQVVELGPTAEVLDHPGHPYTRALLASVPSLDQSAGLAAPVRGAELPSAITLPTGCFFRERCPFAAAGCDQPQPLRGVSVETDRHLVRCHRTGELPTA